MGYTTEFIGSVTITPPLNEHEAVFLRKFSGTRRMDCEQGPYFVDRGGFAGQGGPGHNEGVINSNLPPEGQPGLWCQWVPSEDLAHIVWDGGEKFYNYRGWLTYIIDHFFMAGAHAQGQPGFEHFTFNHVVNGVIDAEGEDGERSQVIVRDNIVEGGQAELDRQVEFNAQLRQTYGQRG
jgi:hypothetical protein